MSLAFLPGKQQKEGAAFFRREKMNESGEFYIGDLVILNPHEPREKQHAALIVAKSRPDFVNRGENPYYKIQICGEDAVDERWLPGCLVGKMR